MGSVHDELPHRGDLLLEALAYALALGH